MYKKGHIHFIGIGGIGMSGIAQVLSSQGYKISGCDIDLEQNSVKILQKLGCSVYKGNCTEYCNDETIDILVYSSAIKPDNLEIKNAQARNIPTIHRALMLAELMRTKFSIAISGSHGKTTTTSLISHLLIENDYDPTVIIGGHFENISSNARLGKGDFLIAEADESDKSLLRLFPTIALVNNIDLEHLDTYKDLNDIKETFKKFLSNLPFYGKAFVCTDDDNIKSILPLNHIKIIRYGTDINNTDFCAQDIILESDYSRFTVYSNLEKKSLGEIMLPMPGKHNIINAIGAISIALSLGTPFALLSKAIRTFRGIDRRFSFKGTFKSAQLYDDYGHHPTEIYNTLLVAKKATKSNLTVVFQPQRYTRTKSLWQEFINVFTDNPVDNLIITDIYPASEEPIANINSKKLVEEIKAKKNISSINYISSENNFEQITESLKQTVKPNDLVLFLGAGKVNKIIDKIKED